MRKLIPNFLLNWYHFILAFGGTLFYRFPARKLIVIGVTGTNGKSTTVDMISRIFREAGRTTASLSSIRFQIGDREWRNTLKMTMPGRTVIQRFLRQAKNEGCTHVVLEVTSEGMLQHRHRFIPFHAAVFTNLSPEHIERHGSFENYKKTKGKLFSLARGVHVINADDEHAPFFLRFPAEKTYTYSILNRVKDDLGVQGENGRENGGLRFSVEGTEFHMNLLGSFNAYNALAAIAVAKSQGISLEVCKRALEKMQGVPGRMEEVISSPFRVVVDYAFTPAALEKVYETFRENPKSDPSTHSTDAQGRPELDRRTTSSGSSRANSRDEARNSKLICVLGAAGGGRDRWKRPVLGKIASESCDVVIVTNEDPYDEDPRKIMDEVAAGAKGKAKIIPDRREAIRKGLTLASPGDTVVITGKGSEDSIAVAGGKKIPWDDREAAREEWTKLQNRGTL